MLRPPAIWRSIQEIPKLLGMQGKIVSFTRVYNGPKNVIHRVPYYVALIELQGSQKRILVEICQEREQDIKIEAKIVLVPRRHKVSEKGLIHYIIKGKIVS